MDERELPTILIVDDNEPDAHLLRQILVEGHRTLVALNAASVFQHLTKTTPDLILMDVLMPGLSGFELCKRLKDNPLLSKIPIIFVSCLEDESDEAAGFDLGVVDYITKPVSPAIVRARVKTHLTLAKQRSDLEDLNIALAAQNKELREATQLREDVERITRHDIKSPLTGVIGFSETLLDSPLDPDSREIALHIRNSGLRILELINRSFDLLRIEQGNYRLKPVAVDALHLIHQAISEIRQETFHDTAEFRVTMNGRPMSGEAEYFIWGEELLCFSLFTNLLKNAAEASPKNEIITIDLDARDDQRVFSIHNHGSVPEPLRERFFEKYSTWGKQGGMGLGTYSARLITETHGGSIELLPTESDTTIVVTLPAVPPAAPGKPSHESESSPILRARV